MQDCLLYGFSTFLPSILKAMNYNTLQANYLTIPVYMWGAISFLFLAWASDKISMRGPVSQSQILELKPRLTKILDFIFRQHLRNNWVYFAAHSEA